MKYITRINGEWLIDPQAQKILDMVYPIIRSLFPTQIDGIYIPDNINGLIEMERNSSKIIWS